MLADNVSIHHPLKGKRTEKKRAKVKAASNQWHTLRVDFTAKHFNVILNDMDTLEWDDDAFKSAGVVDVWTKGDSVTLLDDFVFESKKEITGRQFRSSLFCIEFSAARPTG